MTALQCPNCHAPAATAYGKPYCLKCGWNRAEVLSQLRWSVKASPIAFPICIAIAYWWVHGWRKPDPFIVTLFGGVFAIPMLLGYFFTVRALRRVESQPAPGIKPHGASADESPDNDDSTGKSTDAIEPSPQDATLLRASRPREIRMSSQGRFGLIGAIIFALGIATAIGLHLYTLWVPYQSFVRFRGGDWATAAVAGLLLLAPYGIWCGQQKECDLLENGEVTLAKVTRQWNNQNGSCIECEFKDFSGQSHKVIASDTTKKLYEGMSVPVFYDRDNPKRQIAYCSTLHEVVG